MVSFPRVFQTKSCTHLCSCQILKKKAIWCCSAGLVNFNQQGPHNSLRACLTAALLYTYIKREKGGLNSLKCHYIQKLVMLIVWLNDKAAGITKLDKTSLPSYQIKSWCIKCTGEWPSIAIGWFLCVYLVDILMSLLSPKNSGRKEMQSVFKSAPKG